VGSSITTYNSNGGTSTQYYAGANGTGPPVGSPIVSGGMATSQTSADAASTPSAAASTTDVPSQATLDPVGATIAIAGSDQLIDPGTGSQTIQFLAGATDDTLVLHLSGSDQVLGFDPSAGDALDLSSLLAEAGVNIGSDISRLADYVSVANVGGSAAILFDPTGQGGGSQVALLENDGGLVAQLQTFKDFVA
jgi:hypothetical protein